MRGDHASAIQSIRYSWFGQQVNSSKENSAYVNYYYCESLPQIHFNMNAEFHHVHCFDLMFWSILAENA